MIAQTSILLLAGEYIGTDPMLYGQMALLTVKCERGDTESQDGIVKAQFNNKAVGEAAYGWHEFPESQFEIDWDYDQ